MGIRTSEDDDIVSRHVGGYVFLWDVFVVVIDVGVGGKGRISSARSAIIFSPRVRWHSSPPSPRLLGTLTVSPMKFEARIYPTSKDSFRSCQIASKLVRMGVGAVPHYDL